MNRISIRGTWRPHLGNVKNLGEDYPRLKKGVITVLLLVFIYYAVTSIAAYLSAPRIEMTMSPIAGRVAVAVKPAEKGIIERKITYTGSALPYFSTAIIPRVGGWLKEIHVDVGERVKRGQLLVRLDRQEIETKLNDRRAQRIFMEQEFERNRRLVEAGAIAQSEFDRSRAMYEQARAEEENVSILVGYTEITAPFDGVVAEREKLINLGEYVQPGTHLMMLSKTDKMRIQVRIAEQDIPFVKAGTEAIVRFPSFSERYKNIQAKVFTVIPRLDPTTRMATVEIIVENPEGLIAADMYAIVDLILQNKNDAILIPRHAILEVEGKPSVFVTDGVVAMRHEVVLGIASGDMVEITEGIKEGEMVIEKGIRGLVDGQEVNIVSGF